MYTLKFQIWLATNQDFWIWKTAACILETEELQNSNCFFIFVAYGLQNLLLQLFRSWNLEWAYIYMLLWSQVLAKVFFRLWLILCVVVETLQWSPILLSVFFVLFLFLHRLIGQEHARLTKAFMNIGKFGVVNYGKLDISDFSLCTTFGWWEVINLKKKIFWCKLFSTE